MKAKHWVAFYFGLIIFSGCAPTDILPELKREGNARENRHGDFVELKDGTLIDGTISHQDILYREATMGNPGSVTIAGEKYWNQNIIAFQKGDVYYRKIGRLSFAERIVKGKINAYRGPNPAVIDRTSIEPRRQYVYLMQKGDKAPIVIFELNKFKKLIQDDQKAVDELEKYEVLDKKQKKLLLDMYANNALKIYNED